MIGYYVLFGVLFLIGTLVSSRLKSKFKEYGEIPIRAGMTGKEVAEKMLHDNGIFDVKVTAANGFLSDHYNPSNKTVNLSPEVYNGNSISAAAVAAHECGHAVQHATAYSWLQFRSMMVPTVQVGARFSQILIIAGMILAAVGSFFSWVFLAGIVLFALTTVFSLVTLPVEYDASNRALAWLNKTQILVADEHEKAKDALKWAARTYVVAAISSIATLLYYIMIFMGRRD